METVKIHFDVLIFCRKDTAERRNEKKKKYIFLNLIFFKFIRHTVN